jgi:UDP-glucose 4-epimerase
MRILVTGAGGLIGGRISDYLIKAGYSVAASTRNPKAIISLIPGIKPVQIDWNDIKSIEAACKNIDVVLHAAGMNAQDCASNPNAALEFNGNVTARLVAAAVNSHVQKLVYMSTAHVYSNKLVGEICENKIPLNSHPYATSHIAGESATLGLEETNLVGLVLRLSNVVGEPINKNANCWMLLANDLCREAINFRTITLKTSGKQQRDFISLGDVCKASDFFIRKDINKGGSNIFNVGGGRSIRVYEMARIIATRCHSLFGYYPDILINNDDFHNSESETLKYSINKLLSLGFVLNNDLGSEIDRILKMCMGSTEK